MTSYTATTANASNKITATALKPKAVISIQVNGLAHVNGATATWLPGINTVTINVRYGTTTETYTVIVIKDGTIKSLTVASTAGTEAGDTEIVVTEPLTDGCVYKYQTGESLTLPVLDDDLSEWDDWDGESEITAVTGDDIIIAEVAGALAKAAGKTVVASLA